MAWITLTDAHTLLGTSSPGDDATVQGYIDTLSALIAGYLGRDLIPGTHVQTFFRPHGLILGLDNYPVDKLNSVKIDGQAQSLMNFTLDKAAGLIYLKACDQWFYSCKEYEINYDGGMTPLPVELVQMFQQMLKDFHAAGGMLGGSSGGGAKVNVPAELEPFLALLDLYRARPMVW
jgi:hypothetical protein